MKKNFDRTFWETCRLAGAVFVMFAILALCASEFNRIALAEKAAALETEDPFSGTQFKQYFKEGKYSDALIELDKLIAVQPGEVLYHRYYGITLDRLGHYEEALEAFRRADRLAPENPAVLYFWSLSSFHAGRREEGRALLNRVRRFDGNGFYGVRAREELAKLAPPFARFSGGLAVSYEYDSNVRIRSKEDDRPFDQTAGRYRLDFNNSYVLFKKKNALAGLLFSGYQTFNDDNLNEYNVTSLNFGEYAIYRTPFKPFPLSVVLRHTIAADFLAGGLFTFGNYFLAELRGDINRHVRLSLLSENRLVNYATDGSTPALLSRDQFETGITERVQYFFDRKRQHWMYGEFEVGKTNARGSLYDAISYRAGAGFQTALPHRLSLAGGWNYRYQHFPHYSLTPVREDSDHSFYVNLSRRLTEDLMLAGYLYFRDVASGSDIFEYERTYGGVRLSWDYS